MSSSTKRQKLTPPAPLNELSAIRGRPCVLVMSPRGRETQALQEVRRELTEIAQRDDDSPPTTATKPIHDAIEEELAQLRDETKKSTSTDEEDAAALGVSTGIECISVVRLPSRLVASTIEERDNSAVTIVNRIFDEAISTRTNPFRHVDRLIPMQVSYSSALPLEEVIESTTPYLTAQIAAAISLPTSSSSTDKREKTPSTFAIYARIRHHDALDRMTVVKAAAEVVEARFPSRFKVELETPEIVILIEVLRSFFGFSVVSGADYRRFAKYNLQNSFSRLPESSVLVERKL